MGWITSMRKAIEYIEEHLLENISGDVVAEEVYISSFHFQRMFSAITGFSISEYIRNRRLTLAGQEMSFDKDLRVIDIALKYGYESPESFSKAFQRFHGFSPSFAFEKAMELRFFSPLLIQITIKGGFNMSNSSITLLERLTFKPFGPYRYIGKGICAAPGSGDVFASLWKEYETISKTLNDIKEYALPEEPHIVAYMDGKGLEEYGH